MSKKSIQQGRAPVSNAADLKKAKSAKKVKTVVKNLPDQIVDLFLALVFIDELKPGDRLPPELELTKILKVNQSSLRMAMRVLSRMKVIESTRGSGLVVLNYKLESGPNFYSELVRIPELYLGASFLLSLLDQMSNFFGLLMRSVIDDMNAKTSLGYLVSLDKQIEYLKSKRAPSEIAAIDINTQGEGSLKIENPILQSMFNSFRPLRAYMMEIYYSISGNHLEHIEAQKAIWTALIEQRMTKDEYIDEYLRLLTAEFEILRQHLEKQPPHPKLLTSPLQHYPELISLN